MKLELSYENKQILINELNKKYKNNLANQIDKDEDEKAGIYIIYNVDSHLAYIGRSNNIYKRANTHFSNMRNLCHINEAMNEDYMNGDRFIAFTLMRSTYQGEEDDVESAHIVAFREYATMYGIGMYNTQHHNNRSFINHREDDTSTSKNFFKSRSSAVAMLNISEALLITLLPYKYSIKDQTKEVKRKADIRKWGHVLVE